MAGATMPQSRPWLNCSVYLECTTGIGDLTMDIISGVSVALGRGCVAPVTIHTRWERADRHYDWAAIVSSDLITFSRPVRIGDDRSCLHSDGSCHAHRRPWPGLGGPPSSLPAHVVVVPIQRTGNLFSCGLHTPRNWMASQLPGMAHAGLVAAFLRVARSIHFRSVSLPPDMHRRAVIHARRGDKIGLGFNSEPMLAQIYAAVERWASQHAAGAHAEYTGVYLVSDDPRWAFTFSARLRALGVDLVHNATATPTDDLAALMSGALIVRAATISQFSNLASILSGVPMLSFRTAATPDSKLAESRAATSLHLERAWAAEGILNVSYYEQPDASQPDASQPGASQLGASQPGASQPGASQPDASQQRGNGSALAGPSVVGEASAGSADSRPSPNPDATLGTATATSSPPTVHRAAATGTHSADGFRSIEVFVGAKALAGAQRGSHQPSGYRSDRDTPGTWHGQVGQDRTIHKLFGGKRHGFFVDLASNVTCLPRQHPSDRTQTRALQPSTPAQHSGPLQEPAPALALAPCVL